MQHQVALVSRGKSAVISECGRYRYLLSRIWDAKAGRVLFVGLNPSTADAERDDPTVRRCVAFARSWGYGGILIANLFALRSKNPKLLLNVRDPIGPENDGWIGWSSSSATLVIVAWGTWGDRFDRGKQVQRVLPGAHCLGVTKDGAPRHPLYMPAGVRPSPFEH